MTKSGVIYSINYKQCSKVYIGQTGQKLQNRIIQHKSDLQNVKNIIVKKRKSTAALQHTIETKHTFNYDRPKILSMEAN